MGISLLWCIPTKLGPLGPFRYRKKRSLHVLVSIVQWSVGSWVSQLLRLRKGPWGLTNLEVTKGKKKKKTLVLFFSSRFSPRDLFSPETSIFWSISREGVENKGITNDEKRRMENKKTRKSAQMIVQSQSEQLKTFLKPSGVRLLLRELLFWWKLLQQLWQKKDNHFQGPLSKDSICDIFMSNLIHIFIYSIQSYIFPPRSCH